MAKELKAFTLYDKLRTVKTLTRHDGLYGVEIETETNSDYSVPRLAYWESKTDGSLRGFGIEYVLKVPLNMPNLREAMDEFETKTDGIPFVQNSDTASVHVHMNMLNETVKTFGNILTLYILTENLLLNFSGERRKNNLFCLGISDAEQTLLNIIDLLQAFERKRWGAVDNYTRENAKYAAVNIATIGQFGSLEFRSFRGETDKSVILQWVELLNSILEFSRQDLNPLDIIKHYAERGASFFEDVFGPDNWYKIYGALDTREADDKRIEKNYWYAAQVANAVKDWGSFTEAPVKKLLPGDLEKWSSQSFGKTFDDLTAAERDRLFDLLELEQRNVFRPRNNDPVFNATGAAGLVLNGVHWGVQNAVADGIQLEPARPAMDAWAGDEPDFPVDEDDDVD